MKTVLLPVKGFSEAKQRLAPVLNPTERSALARAMLKDVLAAVAGSRSTERAIVITASSEVRDLSLGFGFEVVDENTVAGHSAAVNRMTLELGTGASRLLSIASDLPTLRADEIDGVLDADFDGLALMPSRDQTGTNGVLMQPGRRIEMEYGTDSLRRHLASAQASRLSVDVVDIPGIRFDVDTAKDLFDLMDTRPLDTHTWSYLSRGGPERSLRAL